MSKCIRIQPKILNLHNMAIGGDCAVSHMEQHLGHLVSGSTSLDTARFVATCLTKKIEFLRPPANNKETDRGDNGHHAVQDKSAFCG